MGDHLVAAEEGVDGLGTEGAGRPIAELALERVLRADVEGAEFVGQAGDRLQVGG